MPNVKPAVIYYSATGTVHHMAQRAAQAGEESRRGGPRTPSTGKLAA